MGEKGSGRRGESGGGRGEGGGMETIRNVEMSNSQACRVHLLKEPVSELVTNSQNTVLQNLLLGFSA